MSVNHSARPDKRSYKSRPFTHKKSRAVSRIPVDKFINRATPPTEEVSYVPHHSFHDFGLNKQTVATLDHLGFTTPSAIQDQAIAPALAGRDVIGLANTGTGKTVAFLLPIIERLTKQPSTAKALILAPTRELAQQIDDEFRRFAAGQRLYSALVVGGVNINKQIQAVKRGPQVIIGTPGRVKDLIGRRVLRLATTTTFVLDEADRMCDMGFVRDIRSIEAELPKDRYTYCFSATMTADVKAIVEEFMRDPVTISVVKQATNDHIEQDVVRARDKNHKVELLVEMLRTHAFEKTIVFGDTKYGVQRLAEKLTKLGLPAEAIHGNKSQSQRERALDRFKRGNVAILVATDVAARGLDIPNVSHVVNFDTPQQYEDYVHRIGRTGRAGKSGVALTFVSEPTAKSTPQKATNRSNSQKPPKKRRLVGGAAAEDRLVRLIDGL